MKTLLKLPMFILLLSGFMAFSQADLINFKSAASPETGFSPHDPIIINTPYKLQTRKKAEYFFNGLRTHQGERLEVTEITEVPNPNFKKPAILIHNYITGEVINKGNGKYLKKVTLKAANSGDIYEVYVNTNIKEDLKVPQAFLFEVPENQITAN